MKIFFYIRNENANIRFYIYFISHYLIRMRKYIASKVLMDAMILKYYKTLKRSTKFFPFEIIEQFFSDLDRECKDRIFHIFYFTVACSYAKL